jgi:hypothetical protein
MNTFVIGGKRYRIKSKARFITFITVMLVTVTLICGFMFGGGVSGKEKTEVKPVMVQSGDTLWSIADAHKPAGKSTRQYVADIRAINEVDPGRLQTGMVIEVPVYAQ